MLKLENVRKEYGNGKGIRNVSFQISKGKVCALLGHNGCGKTTTFRLLLGLLKKEEGQILYNKQPLDSTNYRLFGYIPEERSLLRGLTVEEHVYYLARLKKLEDAEIENSLEYWIHFLNIEQYRKTKIIELSKGNQQKVQMLCALIHNPEIIIFDEPLNGLDVDNVEIFKRLLMKLKNEKKIILISSHQYQNIEAFCDQVVYLKNGKVVLKGDILKMKLKQERRILTFHTKKELFKKENGIIRSTKIRDIQIVEVENKQVAYNLIHKLMALEIEHFQLDLVSMADILKEKLV